MYCFSSFFFFQAEDGIRDHCVTGVQTCALPIFSSQIANTLACCAKRVRRQFSFQPISLNRSPPLRFAFQTQQRPSSTSCSSSRPSQLRLHLVFTQPRSSIQAHSSASVCRSSRMLSPRLAQESAMTQSLAQAVTSATRQRSDPHV